jgi:PPOX class probable F420-dependent enzyme
MTDFPSAEAFLREPNIAVLATVDHRGRPHAVPVWYLYEEGVLILTTTPGSQKHRNVEAHPDVTLVVDRRSIPYYAVIVRGKAKVGGPLSTDELVRMATRYYGDELGRAYAQRSAGENEMTIRIRPSRMIEYKAETGRTSG